MSGDAPASNRAKVRLVVAIAAGCLIVAAVLVLIAGQRNRERERASSRAVAGARASVASVLDSGRPWVVFRSVDRYHPELTGRLFVSALGPRGLPERGLPAGPECARVAFDGGHGLCLRPPGGTGFSAVVLDSRLRATGSVDLGGTPSRTRISPDGRLGAVTSFVAGHSYAAVGQFSTQTTLIDLTRGRKLVDVEKLALMKDGRPVHARDLNVWGVTFAANGDELYATVAFGGHNHLARYSLRRRSGRVIHDHVECPSLSPDGTRIAYKYALPGTNPTWRLHVLDLRGGRDVALAEPASIDDQVAWADDRSVLYERGDTTWTVPADGSGRPAPWLRGGVSPGVVRPAA
jgi:hypothetical protein